MNKLTRFLAMLVSGIAAFGLAAPVWAAPFEISRIFIEYNSTDNDLGFHVSADAENWTSLKILNSTGNPIFSITTGGGWHDLGLSELFFEGAEPTLDEFPLDQLLALFPEGKYKFIAGIVGGGKYMGTGTLSHAVPAGPSVATDVIGDTVIIRWEPVTGPPPGFPNRAINIVGYQVIVDPFQVTLPASSTQVTLPAEFVESLSRGAHAFEVLAIDVSGNQTITAGTFDLD